MPKRSLHLVPIQELETETQLTICRIRNQAEVRRAMYTDHIIGTNEHLQWISRLKTDRSQIVFAIVDEARQHPYGVFGLHALDFKNKRCEWGFYISPGERGAGIGTAVESAMLNFVFTTLGIEKLNGAVLEGNEAALRFYRHFGFEQEGFRTSEIARGDCRLGIHLLGLQRHVWEEKLSEDKLWEDKRPALDATFEVEVHWSPSEESPSAIDQIEAARARNNVNWMSILRLAVEKSPTSAKQIIAEIREVDQQISTLTAQIELER